jgi:hypothetical protein
MPSNDTNRLPGMNMSKATKAVDMDSNTPAKIESKSPTKAKSGLPPKWKQQRPGESFAAWVLRAWDITD